MNKECMNIVKNVSLKKLNKAKDKEYYRVEIPDRFTAMENLDAEVNINSAWKTIMRAYQD
jgi:hypothetical protein